LAWRGWQGCHPLFIYVEEKRYMEVPMGVPDETPHPPRRKGINEVLEFID